MHRRNALRLCLATTVLAAIFAIVPAPASACPLCKYANEAKQHDEEANRRPKAYMYSILFMLSMPATLLSGFSYAFYRVWKKHQLLMGDAELTNFGDDVVG